MKIRIVLGIIVLITGCAEDRIYEDARHRRFTARFDMSNCNSKEPSLPLDNVKRPGVINPPPPLLIQCPIANGK